MPRLIAEENQPEIFFHLLLLNKDMSKVFQNND